MASITSSTGMQRLARRELRTTHQSGILLRFLPILMRLISDTDKRLDHFRLIQTSNVVLVKVNGESDELTLLHTPELVIRQMEKVVHNHVTRRRRLVQDLRNTHLLLERTIAYSIQRPCSSAFIAHHIHTTTRRRDVPKTRPSMLATATDRTYTLRNELVFLVSHFSESNSLH
nr:MAG TPA: hypothetical protein [Caudoviricetes sp.]